jgi:putative sugar O-methyltransferase
MSETAVFRDRVNALAQTAAYQSYERVRDWVLEVRGGVPSEAERNGAARPSDYWSEELAGFEYMLDASPLIVDKLKHHSYHLTGLRVYDYRTHKDRAEAQMRSKLDALRAVGDPALFVPEPQELGGFGFEVDDGLFTIDTLKYYEALIALDKGGALHPFRRGDERRVVLEIGGGWGGFAFQFKRVTSNVSYVIVDLPETFLFSATYLMAMFPEASVAFYGRDQLASGWPDADFVFIPHFALSDLKPPRLDLAVNMVSFQEMTSEQVEGYVSHVHAISCPYLYSLNRERSAYNPQIDNVHEIIGRWYEPHDVEVLPVSYVHMLDTDKPKKPPKPGKPGKPRPSKPERKQSDYRHILGSRRSSL